MIKHVKCSAFAFDNHVQRFITELCRDRVLVLLVKLEALSDSLFGQIEVLFPPEVAFNAHIFKFFLPGILS